MIDLCPRGHLNCLGHPDEHSFGPDVEFDNVQRPSHYNIHPSGVEAITVAAHHGFNVGSAIKYLWRAGLKDGENITKDLRKAMQYIEFEINLIETGHPRRQPLNDNRS